MLLRCLVTKKVDRVFKTHVVTAMKIMKGLSFIARLKLVIIDHLETLMLDQSASAQECCRYKCSKSFVSDFFSSTVSGTILTFFSSGRFYSYD